MGSRLTFSAPRVRILAIAMTALFIGCGSKPAPVDNSKAKQALTAALDAWKRGDKPKSLQPIVVQDMDWMGGAKLLSYEMNGEPMDDHLNLRCPVKIKIVGADGKETERAVVYIIGTSPVVSVFREFKM